MCKQGAVEFFPCWFPFVSAKATYAAVSLEPDSHFQPSDIAENLAAYFLS